MDHIVHFRRAEVLLGSFPAITGVDLDIDTGEIVAICGPNGSGKTTLLRAIGGSLPVSGTARVCGIDLVSHRRDLAGLVGYIGHRPGLYDDLSVIENLRLVARCRRQRDHSVRDAIEIVRLSQRLCNVKYVSLSAGQRRRTALAALVIAKPRVWLLDEPHAGLDSDGQEMLDEVLCEAASRSTTVVVTTHEPAWPANIGGRRVHIAGGTLSAPLSDSSLIDLTDNSAESQRAPGSQRA